MLIGTRINRAGPTQPADVSMTIEGCEPSG